MKKIFLTICMAGVLLMLGCEQKNVTTTETVLNDKVQNLSYTESAINCWPQDLFEQDRIMQFHYPQKDIDGSLFEIEQEYKENSKKKIHLFRVQLMDGLWERKDISWEPEMEKQLNSKNVVIDNYAYSDKGILFLWLTEYSMYPKTYYNNTEQYKESYYAVNQYCFRIDEVNNSVKKLELPKLTAQSFLKQNSKNQALAGEGEIIPNQLVVLKEGNIFLASVDSSISGLYNGETGKKIGGGFEVSEGFACSQVAAGNDFFVLAGVNSDKNKIEIKVFNEEGEKLYTIPTEIKFEQEKYMTADQEHIIVGAGEDEIFAATKEGLFRAELGEEKLETIIDVKRDNTYYLSSDYILCDDSVIIKGQEDDYYIAVKKSRDYEMDKTYLCHYTKE